MKYNIDSEQKPFRLLDEDGYVRYAACTEVELIHMVTCAVYNGALSIADLDVEVRVDVALHIDQVPGLDPVKVEEKKKALWSANPL